MQELINILLAFAALAVPIACAYILVERGARKRGLRGRKRPKHGIE